MDDLISRQDAIDVLNRGLSKIPYVNNTDEEMIRRDERIGCIQEVAGLPTVPRKGEWIDYSDEGFVECPFCHSATNCDGNKDELHYCFSCGADMREGDAE